MSDERWRCIGFGLTNRRPHPDAVEMAHEFLRRHGIQPHHVNRTDDGQTWSFWVEIEKANRMCELHDIEARLG